MSSYKLTYFDVQARGEVSRLLFRCAGVEFEDQGVQFAEWPALKNDASKVPTGVLPVLEVDGQVVTQSQAINRFLAKRFGLFGADDWQTCVIDQICENLKEMMDGFYNTLNFTGEIAIEQQRQNIKEYFLNDSNVKKKFNLLNKFLEDNNKGSGFFVGDKVSVADLSFYATCGVLPEEVFLERPLLKKLYDRVGGIANIKKYTEGRTRTFTPLPL